MQEFEDSFEDSCRICSVAAKMMSDQILVFYSLRISQFAQGITLFDSPSNYHYILAVPWEHISA